MSPLDTDRNLLFGVLALQLEVISTEQFADACSGWAARKNVALADLLLERSWITAEDRSEVDRLLERKLKKHSGDAHASLVGVAGGDVKRVLAELDDPEIKRSLAAVPEHPGHILLSTVAYTPETRERYTLTRLHAKGGIGQVWLARDTDLGREVALKELRPEQVDNPAVWARFLEEARITGQLEHPGIVPVYELARRSEDQKPFYTMRFVRGRTLSEAIKAYHKKRTAGEPGPLDLFSLVSAFVGVCHAVGYAHSRKVIHRDLKGQNVVLGDFGEVMVLDWGLAKVAGQPDRDSGAAPVLVDRESGHEATIQGQALGTPAYMPPEQAEGRHDLVDERSDVYGLGAILYEILTDQPPFTGSDTAEVLRKVIHEPPSRPRQFNSSVPPALEAICLRAMSKQPKDRYASALDLGKDVQRWTADEPVEAYREPFPTRLGRWARRHKPAVTAAAALLVTAVVALSVSTVFINRERTRAEQSFRQARAAVDDYFTTVSESKLLKVPGMQPLRKELLDSALKYYKQFIQQRGAERSVQAELAATYYRVAMISSVLGSFNDALDAYQKSLALYEGLVAAHPNVARYQSDLAICCNDLGNLQKGMDRPAQALRTHQRALAIREKLAQVHTRGSRFMNELAKSYANLGVLHRDAGRQEEALRSFQRARAINEKLVAEPQAPIDFPSDLGKNYNNPATFRADLAGHNLAIAYLLAQMNRPAEAESYRQQARSLLLKLVADFPDDSAYQSELVSIDEQIAFRMGVLGRWDESLHYHQGARAIAEQVASANPTVDGFQSQVASVYNTLGSALSESGRPAEALPWARKALEIRQRLASKYPKIPGYQIQLASSYLYVGRLPASVMPQDEALRFLRQAEQIHLALENPSPLDTYNLACIRARIVPLVGAVPSEPRGDPQSERHRREDTAMGTLQLAVERGYRDAQNMRQDSDLDALRGRDDFKALMSLLDEKTARAAE